jgi:hypothetical protein
VNTNLDVSKLARMDIQEMRRENLRKWVKANGTPPKEKSFFSQVLSGTAPIGERAARRLENDYGMGTGYLDRNPAETAISGNELDEAIKLLALYRASSAVGRAFILQAAEAAEKLPGQLS